MRGDPGRPVLADGEARSAGPGVGVPGSVLVVGEAPGRLSGVRPLGSLDRKLPALRGVPRVNLLDRYPGSDGKGARFPIGPARTAAKSLLRAVPEASLVLVGRRVAEAFGFKTFAYDWFEWFSVGGRAYAVIPHPSGIVRWWNDPANRAAAERFADEIARLVDSPGGGA
jgi:uracil-DNA glycosylase